MNEVLKWLEETAKEKSVAGPFPYNRQRMLRLVMDIRDRIQETNDERFVGVVSDLEQMANTIIIFPDSVEWTQMDILEFVFNIKETVRLGLDI